MCAQTLTLRHTWRALHGMSTRLSWDSGLRRRWVTNTRTHKHTHTHTHTHTSITVRALQ